jgi:Phage tail assembly chaperone proteins, E, or 41 or 14
MSEALIREANRGNGQLPDFIVEPPRTKDLEVDVMFKAQHITSLHLKEPTAKQQWMAERELSTRIEQAPPHQVRKFMMVLIGGVANVPQEVIDQLPVTKLEEAFDFLLSLRDTGPATGST